MKEEPNPEEEEEDNSINNDGDSEPTNNNDGNSNHSEEAHNDAKETTENLPVVGQYSGFWLILVGAALLFGVVLLVNHKQERKK